MRFSGLIIFLLFAFINSDAQLTFKELRVDYDSAWTYKNLQLIPIRYKIKEDSSTFVLSKQPLLSFAEAMQNRRVKVQEMQYEMGADVNWLQVTNNTKQDIFLQSGEILEGGKQDRMIAETKIIHPGTTEYIHVFCIEKRRWDEKPRQFKYRGIANSDVRKAMDKSGRQSDVWKEIDQQFEKEKKTSDTWSYLELFDDFKSTDTAYINYFTKKYAEAERNLAGFIFISGGTILSIELFSSTGLLDISFKNMLSSYVETAVSGGGNPNVNDEALKAFVYKILMNEDAQKSYIDAHGKVHKSEGKTIHLVAYPN